MWFKDWLRPGYRLLAMFLVTTLVLVGVLVWMGWQLVRQEQALSGQRMQERREVAADLAVAALQKHLSQLDAQLARLNAMAAPGWRRQAGEYAATLPGDSALLVFSSDDVDAFPAGRLLFYPNVVQAAGPPPGLFAAAEDLEFRQQDPAKAVDALRLLSRHTDPVVRAEALARMGRNLWKSSRVSEALATYERLASAGAVPVAGLPAELAAREARLPIFERQRDREAARRAATIISTALRAGKWRLPRGVHDFYVSETGRTLGAASPEPDTAISSAAEPMWEEWQALRRGQGNPVGRRAYWDADSALLLVWKSSPERLTVLALGRQYLETQWIRPLRPTLDERNTRITLTDPDGRPVWGGPVDSSRGQTVRLSSAVQLPWNLYAVSVPGPAPSGLSARGLILTGLATLLLLVLGSTYFIGRAAAREVAVARLEADFVASVSHEFRTPITALRQLSELLESGRVESDQDRQEYYRALARESERLHRLVEGLLTFGRLEAGAMHFRFEPLEAGEWLRTLIAEFEREAVAPGHSIELAANGSALRLHADRAALGCVIWNLLDNAVKYSPECSTVWVELGREGRHVAIRVRDRGVGIPEGEQKLIFRKFVRGAAAKGGSIRGAGVGLAMARQIVTAHQGEIIVDSRPGEGSTFTVVLPSL